MRLLNAMAKDFPMNTSVIAMNEISYLIVFYFFWPHQRFNLDVEGPKRVGPDRFD